MKIKKIVSAAAVSTALFISAATAYAKDIGMDTDIYQPDEICGYLYVNSTTDADVYLKVYKHTPETDEQGYLVYDTMIDADTVHVSNTYIYELEYNNFNIEENSYEGSYDIMVGVHKHADLTEEEDIVYHTVNFVVEDTNYTGVESTCTIKVTITEENLEAPVCVASGEAPNYVYDITFSNVSYIVGDANGDGKINVRDCAYIANMLAKGNAEELSEGADINGDGKRNVRDAAALASQLANGSKPEQPEQETTPTEPSTEPSADTTQTTTAVTTTVSGETTSTTLAADPIETTTSGSESAEITTTAATTTTAVTTTKAATSAESVKTTAKTTVPAVITTTKTSATTSVSTTSKK